MLIRLQRCALEIVKLKAKHEPSASQDSDDDDKEDGNDDDYSGDNGNNGNDDEVFTAALRTSPLLHSG